MISRVSSWIFILLAFTSTARAEFCDYRPSHLLGDSGSKAIATGAGVTAVAGTGLQAAGFYTLVHAGSGLTMLGSTAAGASAAGTVGIMAGTAGVIGSTAAFLMSPVVIATAAAAAISGGGVEGYCTFLVDERITEYRDVLKSLQAIVTEGDPSLRLKVYNPIEETARLYIRGLDDEWAVYEVARLYIVEGVLMHRDWFKNTKLGSIAYVVPSPSREDADK